MENYERIVVAIELVLDTDTCLIEKANSIAEEAGAELFLLHAIEHSGSYAAYEAPAGIEVEEQLVKDAIEKMGQYSGLARSFHYVVKVGVAAQVILSEAETIAANLIVVGRRTHTGLSKFLGSTASHVVRNAHTDVLAVHFPEEAEET